MENWIERARQIKKETSKEDEYAFVLRKAVSFNLFFDLMRVSVCVFICLAVCMSVY